MRSPSRSERIATFHQKLRSLGYSSYREYLSGDHWQDVRRRYWASKLAKKACCAGCGATSKLNLHHRTYKRIGEEWLTDLILACRDCHGEIHDFEAVEQVHVWRATKKVLRSARKEKGLKWRDVS